MPEESRKKLSEVHPEETFKSKEGKEIKSLEELQSELSNMSKESFGHHVNNEKNDYAAWVNDSVGDETLAVELRKTTDMEETKKILQKRIDELKKRVHMGEIIKKINSFNFQKAREKPQQPGPAAQPTAQASAPQQTEQQTAAGQELNLGDDRAGEVSKAPMPVVPDFGAQPEQKPAVQDSQPKVEDHAQQASAKPSQGNDLDLGDDKAGDVSKGTMPNAPDMGSAQQQKPESLKPNQTQQESDLDLGDDRAGEVSKAPMPAAIDLGGSSSPAPETQPSAQSAPQPSAPDIGNDSREASQASAPQPSAPDLGGGSSEASQASAPQPSAPDIGNDSREASQASAPQPSAPDIGNDSGEASQASAPQPSSQEGQSQAVKPSAPDLDDSKGNTPDMLNKLQSTYPYEESKKTEQTQQANAPQEQAAPAQQAQQEQGAPEKKKGLFKKIFSFKK